MMKIVLIAENPNVAKMIVQSLFRCDPELDKDYLAVAYAAYYSHLNGVFDFPRGRAYSEFPLTDDVRFKEFTFFNPDLKYFAPVWGIRDNNEHSGSSNFKHKLTHQGFVDKLLGADAIYFAIDPGPSGSYAQLRVAEWLTQFPQTFDLRHVDLKDASDVGLDNAVKNARPIPDLKARAHRSIVRRYFDYNYLLNARPIMGLTGKTVLGSHDRGILTKHELQILYHLRDRTDHTEATLLDLMKGWQGSGRYVKAKNDWYFTGIGSDPTREGMVQTLDANGFILCDHSTDMRLRRLSVSEDGHRFLEALHPGCEDMDMVFRINEWSHLPMDEAKARIDRYLLTYFGRQKRFLSKRIAKREVPVAVVQDATYVHQDL